VLSKHRFDHSLRCFWRAQVGNNVLMVVAWSARTRDNGATSRTQFCGNKSAKSTCTARYKGHFLGKVK
jgi:hypothetical protein